MTPRGKGYLVFEDATYGSATAVGKVPRAGYRWVPDGDRFLVGEPDRSAHAKRGPWLMEAPAADDGPWGYRTRPFRKDREYDLARLPDDFAKRSTPEQFRAFANRHGFLGHPVLLATRPEGIGQPGESLAYWEHHARQVRILIALAKWIRRREEDKLRPMFLWARDPDRITVRPGAVLDRLEAEAAGRPYEPPPPSASRIVVAGRLAGGVTDDAAPWFWRLGWRLINEHTGLHDGAGRQRWKFGDVLGPAWWYMCDVLNKEVEGHVSPRLMPFAPPELQRVYYVPDCLRSIIYFQLQLIVTRGAVVHDSKACEHPGCANFFAPSGNKRYCSESCQRWGRSQSNRRYRQSMARAEPGSHPVSGTPIITPKLADDDGPHRTVQGEKSLISWAKRTVTDDRGR